jgi:hypothetical protein
LTYLFIAIVGYVHDSPFALMFAIWLVKYDGADSLKQTTSA